MIPATSAAEDASKFFAEGGALRPFVNLTQFAILRPPTPAYAVISTTFEKAAKDVMNGADPAKTADNAVAEIDANIKANDGYGF